MDWIVTTARTVEEAETRALDLLGVDGSDAEIQVIEEGKTGLFGRTKSEARVRARIKPKAPPAKDERRQGRGDSRRGRSGSGGGGSNKGGRSQGGNQGGGNKGGNNKGNSSSRSKSGSSSSSGGSTKSNGGGDSNRSKSRSGGNSSSNKGNSNGGNSNGGNGNSRSRSGGSGGRGDSNKSNSGGGSRGRSGGSSSSARGGEDRVEMPVAEQRETLEAFVTGVATSFDSSATVQLVEEGTTLLAEVQGETLSDLIGNKASTLQSLEELARTAMHRAAAGRRYHRIQVDVDSYRARRREALARFAVQIAEGVSDSGVSKAMEPMGAADRKLIHDAVADVKGVETVSEGRDPRRYIVIHPTDSTDEEE